MLRRMTINKERIQQKADKLLRYYTNNKQNGTYHTGNALHKLHPHRHHSPKAEPNGTLPGQLKDQ